MDNTVHHNSIYPPLLTFPKGQGGGQETIFTMRIITETTESTMIWLFLVLCVYLILTTIPVDLVHDERMAAYGPALLSFLSSQGKHMMLSLSSSVHFVKCTGTVSQDQTFFNKYL